jgi:excisionase family DNA binding protein
MAIARMRTIRQCYEYFKENDSESGISEYYIRMLAKQNKIPVFRTGRKQLINLDKLIEYLNGDIVDEEDFSSTDYGKIRRVSE